MSPHLYTVDMLTGNPRADEAGLKACTTTTCARRRSADLQVRDKRRSADLQVRDTSVVVRTFRSATNHEELLLWLHSA